MILFLLHRQQIRSLNHVHEKEVDEVKQMVRDWRCAGCQNIASSDADSGLGCSLGGTATSIARVHQNQRGDANDLVPLEMSPIGVVNSWFPEKRGTPRQPGVSGSARGKLTLYNTVFTNPEHALEGLEEYSHMW